MNSETTTYRFNLPDVPSELLAMALKDFEACEANSDKYKIDMGYWMFQDKADLICHVCLAGAVMAQHPEMLHDPELSNVNIPEGMEVSHMYPTYYREKVYNKLQAINSFREGEVSRGLEEMGFDCPEVTLKVTEYKRDPARFKEDIRKVIEKLQELGH